MYKLRAPIINSDNTDDEKMKIIKKLFKEVLGYTDEEIQQFANNNFSRNIAVNLTLEQAQKIAKPFYDNDIDIYLRSQETHKILFWKDDLGIDIPKESPKDHYYDKPVVSREHLVNPFEEKKIEVYGSNTPMVSAKPTVTCPYCQSTKVSRIGLLSRIASVELWGLASRKIGRQWHCDHCGSDF